ncbi:MAG: S8 family serine peptidase [Anaerolineae bacterium]|nr:S8 family serine peptidase [Anaerolineae bacterium]
MVKRIVLLIGILTLFTAVLYTAVQAQIPPENLSWQAKVDPWVLQTADPALAGPDGQLPQTEFLVYLTEQGDVSTAANLATKEQKGQYVYDTLTAVANRTQPAVITHLDTLGVSYRPFWIVNMIWVRGDMNVVQQMAQRDDVARLIANPTVPLQLIPTTPEQMQRALEAIEPNITLVNAPDLWALGITGAGAVIGGQDTGYDWDHPGLVNQYRGWNGSTADHNYNWHDAIHSGGGVCGPDSPEPCDDHGHGTHTMGTMVGNDMDPSNPSWPAGATNAVGMAPGAKWIGCRNMNVGDGTPATYAECYQWFIAPTDLNGQNPNPALAPHVINNSWGCPASEGCTVGDELLAVTQNVVAAGIITVHSAGNSGSGCNTVNTPSGFYDESYSVGATNNSDVIASFSSRGPSTFDNGLKPDISAPGVGIRSTTRFGNYGTSSGTSMAAPHVAGLVGLLVSAQPLLAGNVDALESLINNTAVPLPPPPPPTPLCGDDQPGDVPNNVYGYGRIDALNAYNNIPGDTPFALGLTKSGPATAVAGELITYTLTVQNLHPISVTNNVVLTDVVPADTIFVAATMPHTFDGTTVEWDFASLTADETVTVTLTVVTDVDTTATMVENNQYGSQSDEAAFVAGLPVQTTIIPFDLGLAKTASATEIMPGDWLTYTITVQNLNSAAATHNVVLTDVVPANTEFVTATLPHSFDGTTVQWENPELAANATWTVTLVVAAPLTTTANLVENAVYSVRSDEVTAVFGLPVQTTVTPLAHALALHKAASAAEINAGDILTYTLTVTHEHPVSPTTNVVLTDVLPAHTTLITASVPFTQDGDIIYWHTPILAAGGVWQVQLVVSAGISDTLYVIENVEYGVRSDEVTAVVTGPPVITFVGTPFKLYLPIVIKP